MVLHPVEVLGCHLQGLHHFDPTALKIFIVLLELPLLLQKLVLHLNSLLVEVFCVHALLELTHDPLLEQFNSVLGVVQQLLF